MGGQSWSGAAFSRIATKERLRMSTPPSDVTTLLRLVSNGDLAARDELYRLVEKELRQCAHAYLQHERPNPALQTTVLINDAFLKLVGSQNVTWEDRSHFYRFAARVMRQLLIDYARQANAQKEGGGVRPASLDEVAEPLARKTADPLVRLVLQEVLAKLTATDPELAEMVKLHLVDGWTLEQIARDLLNISPKQAKTRWRHARAWLLRELSNWDDDHDA
jgi:RNA polymerase sigma factor (TIGR02999 family)